MWRRDARPLGSALSNAITASNWMRSLVCGLPTHEHERSLWAVIHTAFFDDSGTGFDTEMSLMAGYLAPQDRWERFADQWQEILQRKPEVPFLHATDAVARTNHFASWTEKDQKRRFAAFADTIRRLKPRAFIVRLPPGQYRRVTAGRIHPHKDRPFHFLFHCVVAGMLKNPELNREDRVNVLFDSADGYAAHLKNDVDDHLRPLLEHMYPEVAHRLGEVDFKPKERFLPLQAADLLAWHQHARWTRTGHQRSRYYLQVVTAARRSYFYPSDEYLEGWVAASNEARRLEIQEIQRRQGKKKGRS